MQAYIPEFILAGLAMLLLLAETFCKKTPKFIFGLIGAAGTLAMLPFYMEGLYDNIYIILALVATAVTLLLSVDFRAVINLSSNDSKSQDGTGEFYILPLLACVGITSLCKASNLVELFVSLEVLTLSSFIMVGYFRRNLGSTEAGIKYLILGAVSTGFLVFGLAWYFGITGTFIYNETIVSHALAGQTAPAMYLALAMLLLGTAFKIGAVPMQLWIPDVYQGAPTPVTAFLSVASKVAGFALFGIILAPFAVLPPVEFVVALMAAATLLVGNLGAIPQTNLKRMMGYSSIAQAGFILPLFIGTVDGQLAPNAPFYLAVYLVMTFGAFFALAMIRIQRGSEEISAFRGLGKTNPRLALAVFIAPEGVRDYVGAMAVSIHGSRRWAKEWEARNDSSRALLVSSLADRLVEAFAAIAHDKLRLLWNIPEGSGVRPACGYPSQPDHQEKETVFTLLHAREEAGMSLTETWMMQPVSSVCALVFSHPESAYFSVGATGEDQQEDYASRKRASRP